MGGNQQASESEGKGMFWDYEPCPIYGCHGELEQQDEYNVMCLGCESVFTPIKDETHQFLRDVDGVEYAKTPIYTCKFTVPFRGKCGNGAVSLDPKRCEEHRQECRVCGEPATTECNSTILGLMCGAPVCDSCEHSHD